MAVTQKIVEIKQRQIQIIDYLDSNLDKIVDQQKDNMSLLMAALKREREGLERCLIEDNVIEI